MAKVVKGKKAKTADVLHLSLTNKNYMIIGLGNSINYYRLCFYVGKFC